MINSSPSIITYTFSSASSSSSHSFPYREATSLPLPLTLSALIFSHFPRKKKRTILPLFLPRGSCLLVFNSYPLINPTPPVVFLYHLSLHTFPIIGFIFCHPFKFSFLSGTRKRGEKTTGLIRESCLPSTRRTHISCHPLRLLGLRRSTPAHQTQTTNRVYLRIRNLTVKFRCANLALDRWFFQTQEGPFRSDLFPAHYGCVPYFCYRINCIWIAGILIAIASPADCLIFLPPPTPLFFFSLLGLLPNHRVAALYFNYSPLGQPHGTDGPLPSWLPLTSASRPTWSLSLHFPFPTAATQPPDISGSREERWPDNFYLFYPFH